jgi:hypothetical protein
MLQEGIVLEPLATAERAPETPDGKGELLDLPIEAQGIQVLEVSLGERHGSRIVLFTETRDTRARPMRRLPVLQNEPGEDAAAAARPGWQWLLFAAGLTVLLWLPLELVAVPLVGRLAALASGARAGVPLAAGGRPLGGALVAVSVLVAFFAAAASAGALVGRFGRRARPRDASAGAVAAAALVGALAALAPSSPGVPCAAAVLGFAGLASAGALGAWAGSRWASRRRPAGRSATLRYE